MCINTKTTNLITRGIQIEMSQNVELFGYTLKPSIIFSQTLRLMNTTLPSLSPDLKSIIFAFLILFLFNPNNLQSQCTGTFTIFTEDFEDNGNTENGGFGRYTSPFDFYDGGSDFWGRVQGSNNEYFLTDAGSGSNISSLNPYMGYMNNFYYAGEDLDDTGASTGVPDGNDIKQITFTNINIGGATNMCFSGLFAAGNTATCGSNGYDAADYLRIFYTIDSGSEVEAMCFNYENCQGDAFNEPIARDPECDGNGLGGITLTNMFQEFTFSIIGTGNSLDLRIEAHMDAADEEIAFDFFQIKSDSPLPITLQDFGAEEEKGDVAIVWTTASETNNSHFLVEHSIDGKLFNEIGKIDGAGNSSKSISYSFMHKNPAQGRNYYRLKQIDFDGAYSYGPIEQVSIKSVSQNFSVAPNPFFDQLTVSLSQPMESRSSLKIIDVVGRVVLTQDIPQDQLRFTLDLATLEPGVYFIQLGQGENSSVQKLTKY